MNLEGSASSAYELRGKLSSVMSNVIDNTLSIEGASADAKATGDAIAAAQKDATDLVNSHANNKDNPHEVTAAQIGLGNVDNTADMDKPVSTAQADAIYDAKIEAIEAARFAQTSVNNHTANRTNPHGVTAAQIGATTAEQVTTMINEALGVIENGTY